MQERRGRPVAVARTLAAAAEKAPSRREAVELYSAAAIAWEGAGKRTQALLLRLSQRELLSAINAPTRDGAAILLLGDPGLGKTQLLRSSRHHRRRAVRWLRGFQIGE